MSFGSDVIGAAANDALDKMMAGEYANRGVIRSTIDDGLGRYFKLIYEKGVWHEINGIDELPAFIDQLKTTVRFITIDFSGTDITEWPENSHITGTLILDGSAIKKLPAGLHVGTLSINNTDITELPEDMIIDSSLYMKDTAIEVLPDHITRLSYFDCRNSRLKKLPANLIVKDLADIRGTDITEKPKGVERIALDDDFYERQAEAREAKVQALVDEIDGKEQLSGTELGL